MYMKKSQQMGVPIGTSLLLVVFVLLALITFATLSLVTARTDKRFSQDTANATQQYYAADAIANTSLRFIDEQLVDILANVTDRQGYFDTIKSRLPDLEYIESDEHLFATFSTPVNENEIIESTISIGYDEEQRFEIVSWKLVYIAEWESDLGLDVIL